MMQSWSFHTKHTIRVREFRLRVFVSCPQKNEDAQEDQIGDVSRTLIYWIGLKGGLATWFAWPPDAVRSPSANHLFSVHLVVVPI